ncbi:ig-like domain-containing protein [Trichonephila inaurata madagascariensis]|uniref:Ig-like domain-containing protein n=1 Tax=Trichonephila inaurata madagascariensis TaxID=2747483 RepID=A0A8X7BQL0_9ARAC|nr:ig-like domain-containing protein [Trichonephila inaurata madagascariensis]
MVLYSLRRRINGHFLGQPPHKERASFPNNKDNQSSRSKGKKEVGSGEEVAFRKPFSLFFNSVYGCCKRQSCSTLRYIPPSADDGVALILWYKDEAPSPIYTLDARQGTLEQARQSAVSTLDHRAYFNMINRPAFLQLDPVQEEDAGEYRCRVDFHKARTVNTVITLKVIGEWMLIPL